MLPSLTSSLPSSDFSKESWPHLKGLQLADPQFASPGSIDIILGADFYDQIIQKGLVKGQANTPIAQCTTLGWIISGPTKKDTSQKQFQSYHVAHNEELCRLVQRFWELESVPATHQTSMTAEEKACEEHFKKTHSRNKQGRYTVKLPFKDSITKLGDSKNKAVLLYNKMKRRFSIDWKYAQEYIKFMNEYELLGHMRPLTEPIDELIPCFYFPHHGILKESSLTTKLRVVFNGSCTTTTGYSLNDILHTGNKLQAEIFDVLLWFRQFRFVFSADIEKMFRQIDVHKDDWNYQRIIWSNQEQQPVTYQLITVTYGLVCAPFLSLRVLQQLVLDEGNRFPKAVTTMEKGRYVDDLFGGADTIKQAQEIVTQVDQLCMAGGFVLQKWISNETSILNSILPSKRLDSINLSLDADTFVHSLGLSWRPATDNLHFMIDLKSNDFITKSCCLLSLKFLIH